MFCFHVLRLRKKYQTASRGLWEIEVKSDDEPAMVMKECVDAASDQKTKKTAVELTKNKCTKNETRKEGDTYISETDCTMREERNITKTITTGDFQSHYQSVTTMQSVPAKDDKVDMTVVVKGKWIGECQPG